MKLAKIQCILSILLVVLSLIALGCTINNYKSKSKPKQLEGLSQLQILQDQIVDLEQREQKHLLLIESLQAQLATYTIEDRYSVPAPIIYDIPLSEDLQQYVYYKCVDYAMPEQYELMLAMMWHESTFRVEVISPTDDYGLMQINICNHEWLEEDLGITDLQDPYQNIDAGTYIMTKLLTKYDGDANRALMCYNMGEGGAATFISCGHTSSNYSDSVLAKLDSIKQNNYPVY
jgi:soluble lytic murein transglycosylase-like protein